MEGETEDAPVRRLQVPGDDFRPVSGDGDETVFPIAFKSRIRAPDHSPLRKDSLAALAAHDPGLSGGIRSGRDLHIALDLRLSALRGRDARYSPELFSCQLDTGISRSDLTALVINPIELLRSGSPRVFCFQLQIRIPRYRKRRILDGNPRDAGGIHQAALKSQIHRDCFQGRRCLVAQRQSIHMGLIRFFIVIGVFDRIAPDLHGHCQPAAVTGKLGSGIQQDRPCDMVEMAIFRDGNIIVPLQMQGCSVEVTAEHLVTVRCRKILLGMAFKGDFRPVFVSSFIAVMACIDSVQTVAMVFSRDIGPESIADVRFALIPGKEPVRPDAAALLGRRQMEIASGCQVRGVQTESRSHDGSRRF